MKIIPPACPFGDAPFVIPMKEFFQIRETLSDLAVERERK